MARGRRNKDQQVGDYRHEEARRRIAFGAHEVLICDQEGK